MTMNHSKEWCEGQDAYNKGRSVDDNPYLPAQACESYREWSLGWHDTQRAQRL